MGSLGEVYTYDDPLAGVVVNVMRDDTDLEWHYDANEFVVSLLTKQPDKAGRSSTARTFANRATSTTNRSARCCAAIDRW